MVKRNCDVRRRFFLGNISRSRVVGSAQRYHFTKRLKKLLVTLTLIIIILIIDFPILWMVSSSLKGPGELFLREPTFIPKDPLWQNYPDIFVRMDFSWLAFWLSITRISDVTFEETTCCDISISKSVQRNAQLVSAAVPVVVNARIITVKVVSQVQLVPQSPRPCRRLRRVSR